MSTIRHKFFIIILPLVILVVLFLPQKRVSTLAPTGTFDETVMYSSLILGLFFLAKSTSAKYEEKNENKLKPRIRKNPAF